MTSIINFLKNPNPASIKEAAELFSVHPDTLRGWEKDGIIQPERSRGNHRRYNRLDIFDMYYLRDFNYESFIEQYNSDPVLVHRITQWVQKISSQGEFSKRTNTKELTAKLYVFSENVVGYGFTYKLSTYGEPSSHTPHAEISESYFNRRGKREIQSNEMNCLRYIIKTFDLSEEVIDSLLDELKLYEKTKIYN